MTEAPKPTSKARASVFIKAAMEALDAAGGSLPLREVKKAVAERVILDAHDLAQYESSGHVRGESVLHFYSIDAVKAGFIRKSEGRWHLTEEGREALKLPATELLDEAVKRYRAWKADQPSAAALPVPEPTEAQEAATAAEIERTFVLETAESDAWAEISDFVNALGPYDFQDLVAALLRGMGYATPHVAPPGPDGGTDILAYPDPLGAKTPHVRVQVKHRKTQKATREEIAALRGIIRQDREIGLFVSSGGFTPAAIAEARNGTVHIKLMDPDDVLKSWIAHYDRLTEEDRGLLRLRPVYFLAAN